jgi:hypothetical protein
VKEYRLRILVEGTRAFAAALAAAAALGGPASALQIGDGDVVAVFQKAGIEVIVNLGQPDIGATVDLTGIVDIAAFDNTLAGAKFVALAVPDPDKTTTIQGTPVPLHNILYSTFVENPAPGDGQVEVAVMITDTVPNAATWFNLLRQLGGTDSVQVSTSDLFSYEAYLGVGGDRIATSFDFSVAGTIDENGAIEIPLWYSQRGWEDFNGPAPIHEARALLSVAETDVEFLAVPEASAVLGTLGGGVVLALLAARRRAASA